MNELLVFANVAVMKAKQVNDVVHSIAWALIYFILFSFKKSYNFLNRLLQRMMTSA